MDSAAGSLSIGTAVAAEGSEMDEQGEAAAAARAAARAGAGEAANREKKRQYVAVNGGRLSPSLVNTPSDDSGNDERLARHESISNGKRPSPVNISARGPPDIVHKIPASPSLRPKSAPDRRISIPSALGALEGRVQGTDYDLLVRHVIQQSDSIAMLQAQVQNVCDLLAHQNRELALAHRRPSFETDMPRPVPLTEGLPIPDPKPPRNIQLREMTPLEKHVLARDMCHKMVDPRKRDGVRKIVYPSDWWKPEDLAFDVHQIQDEVLWKLWHFTRRDQALQTVLTQDELHACKVAARTSPSPGAASAALLPESQQSASSNTPLHARAAAEGTNQVVLALNECKRSRNDLLASQTAFAAQGGVLVGEEPWDEAGSDSD